MAVEARHQNLFPQQLIFNNSEFVKIDQTDPGNNAYNNYMQMGYATMDNPWLAQNCNTIIQPQTTSLKAESGLTSNLAAAPRKRSRDSMENQHNNLNHFPQNIQNFGQKYLCADEMQQQLETDYIISEYTKRMKMEIVERQKQDAKWVLAKMRGSLIKRLQEKEEQVASISKLNSALEERVKNLYIENQIWKDVAQSSEANAQILRNNLDSVLAHVSINGIQAGGATADDEEAESCCGSNDLGISKEIGEGRTLADDVPGSEGEGRRRKLAGRGEYDGGRNRMCKKCGKRESCVLLLPCRHLCLCSVCGTSLQSTCPLCNSLMNATVHVSMVYN